ncbi:hypothetical protein, partial [Neisseria meningitidis]|uniref:hypothetical protein n=1 Tax=Neisseria meningitidis TaxID=487 RepID=UPI00053BD33B
AVFGAKIDENLCWGFGCREGKEFCKGLRVSLFWGGGGSGASGVGLLGLGVGKKCRTRRAGFAL